MLFENISNSKVKWLKSSEARTVNPRIFAFLSNYIYEEKYVFDKISNFKNVYTIV